MIISKDNITIKQQEKNIDNTIIVKRRAKLQKLRAQGIAFPNDFQPTHKNANLHHIYDSINNNELESIVIKVTVAGRMMLKRVMGKASFAVIQDASDIGVNGRIQLYITNEITGKKSNDAFKQYDIGDIISAEGQLFKTKTGELSIKVNTLRLITKSLRPLPDKYHGLLNQEMKYRQRHLDLIINENTRSIFKMRTTIISTIRNFMEQNNFMEVETPMLHNIPSGATAKPFITYHNTLNMKMFLRVAPELYLKRLIIGGFERVFEINRNFRNEGISPRHNPEFTMMEFYAAYVNYQWLMQFIEKIIRQVTIKIHNTENITYQNRILYFSKPFARLTIIDAIKKYAPQYTNAELYDSIFLSTTLKKVGITLNNANLSVLQLALFEEIVAAKLWEPTYIINYPIDVSPLARASDSIPGVTERFELFIAGREIANGFSELNDSEEQSTRFQLQILSKNEEHEEVTYYDADYIHALEYGMPPTGGCGIGIDRLVMLITNSSNIRDVILFPHLRKEITT